MNREIPERDWKVFRTVREAALERYCARVLEECQRIINKSGLTNHERCLELYSLLERRDRDLASAFDAARRSAAITQLARMHAMKVVTDEDLNRFSPEVRSLVIALGTGDFGD